MQEAFHCIHTHDDSQSNIEEQVHTNYNGNGICSFNTSTDCLFKEYLWQLTVSQWQGPKTQVWGCVWNCTQYEFDCFDDLMYCDFANVLMMISIRFFDLDLVLFVILICGNIFWFLFHFLAVLDLFVWVSQGNDQVIIVKIFLLVFVMMWWGCGLALNPKD